MDFFNLLIDIKVIFFQSFNQKEIEIQLKRDKKLSNLIKKTSKTTWNRNWQYNFDFKIQMVVKPLSKFGTIWFIGPNCLSLKTIPESNMMPKRWQKWSWKETPKDAKHEVSEILWIQCSAYHNNQALSKCSKLSKIKNIW